MDVRIILLCKLTDIPTMKNKPSKKNKYFASPRYGAKVQIYINKDGSKTFSTIYRGKWEKVGNSKKGTTEKKAYLHYLEREDMATNSVHGLKTAKHLTFDEMAMSMFRSKRSNKKSIDNDIKNYENHIKPILGEKIISKINEDDFYDLQEYLDKKINARGCNFSLGSKQLYLNIAKSIVNFAAKKKLMNGEPFRDICYEGVPKGRERYFNKTEVSKIFALAKGKPLALVLAKWFLYTGLRARAGLKIQMKHIDLESDTIRVYDSKANGGNEESYYIALHPELRKLVEEAKSDNLNYYLLSVDGNRVKYHKAQEHIKELLKPFNKGLKNNDHTNRATIHTFRHTFVTNLQRAGASLQVQKKLVNHKSLEQTEKYSHIVDGEGRDALLKIYA